MSADARLNRLRAFAPPGGPGPLAAGQTEAVRDRVGGHRRGVPPPERPGRLFDNGQGHGLEENKLRAVGLRDDAAIVVDPARRRNDMVHLDVGVAVHPYLRLFGHDVPAQGFSLAMDPNSLGGVKWSESTTSYTYPQTSAETTRAVAGTSLLCLDGRVEGISAGDRLLVADTADTGQKRQVIVLAVDQIRRTRSAA